MWQQVFWVINTPAGTSQIGAWRPAQRLGTHWAAHWQLSASCNSERIYPLDANSAAEVVGFLPASWSLTTWQLSRSKLPAMFSININRQQLPPPPLQFVLLPARLSWSLDYFLISPFTHPRYQHCFDLTVLSWYNASIWSISLQQLETCSDWRQEQTVGYHIKN